MRLVFITKQNSNPPKLIKTSTPMCLYEPYISKHKLKDLRTLDYYIEIGTVSDDNKTLYDLLINAIREFCKANNINTFTMDKEITMTFINKEIKEYIEKTNGSCYDICKMFKESEKSKDKLESSNPISEVEKPVTMIKISTIGYNLDKILLECDRTDLLNDEEFYKKHILDTSKLIVPGVFQYKLNDEFTNCLADIVIQELIKIRNTKTLPTKEYTPPDNIEDILKKPEDLLSEDDKYEIRKYEEYLTKKQNEELGITKKPVDYSKKWVLFAVDEGNFFTEKLHNISVNEYNIKMDIDNIISAIYDKKIAPVYNNDNICIFVRIETSAYSGKTALRKKYSQHNSGYLGTQYMGSVIGPVVYTYGPNVYANSFGTIYNGGDTFVSDQAAYKSLHTMGYKNEEHIIHHNEINLLKDDNIKYCPVRDELIITF